MDWDDLYMEWEQELENGETDKCAEDWISDYLADRADRAMDEWKDGLYG